VFSRPLDKEFRKNCQPLCFRRPSTGSSFGLQHKIFRPVKFARKNSQPLCFCGYFIWVTPGKGNWFTADIFGPPTQKNNPKNKPQNLDTQRTQTMIWNALRDELFLTSNKRRKTAPLGTVSTVVLTGLGQARGICCLADGSILLTAHNKILVRFPSALLPCTTLAGREGRGRADGTLLEGSFYEPSGIVVRSNDEIVVVDSGNNTLRIIHRLKREDRHMIYTLAGDATEEGFFDGPAVDLRSDGQALFKNPSCAVLLEDGDMAILDTDNHALRHLTATGRVSTLAGCGNPGFLDGPGRVARFCFPTGLAFDPTEKRLIVSDTGNHAIRMVCKQGIVTTIAGCGAPGFMDGLCADALFFEPMHVVVDGKGTIVIADRANNRIRAIEKTTPLSVKTLAGGENVIGPMSHQRVDGPALDARFKDPAVLALDPTGRLLVAELNAPDQVRVVVVGLFPPVCLYEQLPEMMQLASRANARVKAVEDLSRLADDTETADVRDARTSRSFSSFTDAAKLAVKSFSRTSVLLRSGSCTDTCTPQCFLGSQT
jgi:DNA-binding beta-propeller fold protein YncE